MKCYGKQKISIPKVQVSPGKHRKLEIEH